MTREFTCPRGFLAAMCTPGCIVHFAFFSDVAEAGIAGWIARTGGTSEQQFPANVKMDIYSFVFFFLRFYCFTTLLKTDCFKKKWKKGEGLVVRMTSKNVAEMIPQGSRAPPAERLVINYSSNLNPLCFFLSECCNISFMSYSPPWYNSWRWHSSVVLSLILSLC